ncbi:hypothetical protein D3C81_1137420 [compost metagenome]
MIIATAVAQAIAGTHGTFAQQQSGAFEVLRAVVGVNPVHQRIGCAIGEAPAQQWQQAVAEERRLQRAFDVTLHVDHRRRAGDQVVQPRMGGGGALLLILDVADVEHETHQPTAFTQPQRLALQAIPDRFGSIVGAIQAHAQQHGQAVIP